MDRKEALRRKIARDTLEREKKLGYLELIRTLLSCVDRDIPPEVRKSVFTFFRYSILLPRREKEEMLKHLKEHNEIWNSLFEEHRPVRYELDEMIKNTLEGCSVDSFLTFWKAVAEFLKADKVPDFLEFPFDPFLFWKVTIRLTENLWLGEKDENGFAAEKISLAVKELITVAPFLQAPQTSMESMLLYEFQKFIFPPEYITTEQALYAVVRPLIREGLSLATNMQGRTAADRWMVSADPSIKIRDKEVKEWFAEVIMEKPEVPERVKIVFLSRTNGLQEDSNALSRI